MENKNQDLEIKTVSAQLFLTLKPLEETAPGVQILDVEVGNKEISLSRSEEINDKKAKIWRSEMNPS